METDDIDIWRAAKLLVDRDGDSARVLTKVRADEFLEAGDQVGHAIWLRILAAVNELLAPSPPPGMAVH